MARCLLLSLLRKTLLINKETTMRSHKSLIAVLVASLLCLLPLSDTVRAQSGGTIPNGTTIPVRTDDEINVTKTDGRIYTGGVAEDVKDTRGDVALPRGTPVELIVRMVGPQEYALDLESVNREWTPAGSSERYGRCRSGKRRRRRC